MLGVIRHHNKLREWFFKCRCLSCCKMHLLFSCSEVDKKRHGRGGVRSEEALSLAKRMETGKLLAWLCQNWHPGFSVCLLFQLGTLYLSVSSLSFTGNCQKNANKQRGASKQVFFSCRQSRASCFSLFQVFMLSYNQLSAPVSNLRVVSIISSNSPKTSKYS